MIAKLREVKTLSAEGKAELNKLTRGGVPLGEGMKRVAVHDPEGEACGRLRRTGQTSPTTALSNQTRQGSNTPLAKARKLRERQARPDPR